MTPETCITQSLSEVCNAKLLPDFTFPEVENTTTYQSYTEDPSNLQHSVFDSRGPGSQALNQASIAAGIGIPTYVHRQPMTMLDKAASTGTTEGGNMDTNINTEDGITDSGLGLVGEESSSMQLLHHSNLQSTGEGLLDVFNNIPLPEPHDTDNTPQVSCHGSGDAWTSRTPFPPSPQITTCPTCFATQHVFSSWPGPGQENGDFLVNTPPAIQIHANVDFDSRSYGTNMYESAGFEVNSLAWCS